MSGSFSPTQVMPDCTPAEFLACPIEAVFNQDKIDISGDGKGPKYDLAINFSKANGGGRLSGGTTSTFYINYSGMTVNSFLFSEPVFDIYSAAKVQGIQAEPGSGVIGAGAPTDPEPAPAPLPLLGAIAAFQASRRLRRRLQAAPEAAVEPSTANGPGAVLLTVPVRARRPA